MKDFLIDTRNSNRYLIMVKETLGQTAYCFSTPIYNINSKSLVSRNFEKVRNSYFFKGTNASISICQNRCVFETKKGRIVISLNEIPSIKEDEFESQKNIVVSPTLNGLLFVVKGNRLNLRLKSEIKQQSIRFHPSCFSVMSEKFKPFLCVSTLYAYDEKGNFLPVQMSYEDKEEQTYDISFFNEIQNGTFLFEVNIYEPKFFQDTTVESLHPNINNVYGAIGFIVKTKQFGEQWLYLRPDFSKVPDLTSERIENVLLHIPIFNKCNDNVDVFIPEKRFCSFGSTWNKKVNASTKVATLNNQGQYLTIDVTSMFTNRIEKTLVYNEGLILKKPKGKKDFIAISTGDCYSAPQILEIKFKN